MRLEDERMMRILYSPVDYTHPSYLDKVFLRKIFWDDVLVNYWLLNHYHLGDLPQRWQNCDYTLSCVLSNWYQLPVIAHLTGGYLLRSRLLGQSTTLLSDPQLLAFISLPMINTVAIQNSQDINDTYAWGIAFILNLIPDIPLALRQRISLFFSAEMTLPSLHIARNPDNFNLLRMAMTYANNFN